MSLTRPAISALAVTLSMSTIGLAQLFTDQGLMSGSGLTVVPTATIAPPYEFRMQYSRLGYLKHSGQGVNVVGVTAGLATSLEGYVRITGEQTGNFSSQMVYGFGMKFRIPAELPVVRRLALWTDLTSSDQEIRSGLLPSDAMRMAAIATLDSNGIHPTLFAGISRMNDKTKPLLGAGVTVATGNSTQLGLEYIYGYWGRNSNQAVITGAMRVFSNVSMQVSPGYLSTNAISTWTVALGISFSTSDIDFHPVPVQHTSDDDFILPSFEEMEKEQQGTPGGAPGNGETTSPLIDYSGEQSHAIQETTTSSDQKELNFEEQQPNE